MRRRFFAWALLLAVLLSACANSASEAETLDIYYRAADGGMESGCAVVKCALPVGEGTDRLAEALRLLAEEPDAPKLHTAFPAGISVERCTAEDGCVSVSLSAGYSGLPPMERTLLGASIVLTLCALEEVESVTLLEGDRLLVTQLTAADFLREERSDAEPELCFWLPEPERGCLTGERKTVRQRRNLTLTESVLRQLLSELEAFGLPKDTQVLSVVRRSGVCTVDFSQEFRGICELGAASLRLLIFAIVDTLTELDGVDAVLLRCEGSDMGVCASMDLSAPLGREEAFTDAAMRDPDNAVVTLYLLGADGRLVPVKAALPKRITDGNSTETALRLLLGLDRSWGYRLPFAEGTALLSCAVRDSVGELVLNETFRSGGEAAQELAAYALAATACDAGQLRGIRITTASGAYRSREVLRKNGDIINNG